MIENRINWLMQEADELEVTAREYDHFPTHKEQAERLRHSAMQLRQTADLLFETMCKGEKNETF